MAVKHVGFGVRVLLHPSGAEARLWPSHGAIPASEAGGRQESPLVPGLLGENKGARVKGSFHSPVLAHAVTTPAVISTTTIFILKQSHNQEALGHTVPGTWLGAGLSPLGGRDAIR